MAIEKIGILGGAFDPVHYGHLILASEAKQGLGLQRILFVPTFRSPRPGKKIAASFQQRMEMLKLAVANHDDFVISDVESRYDGVSYSART
jgi:nicotinate-nucleotide adenylyltransferase